MGGLKLSTYVYATDQELPAVQLEWLDGTGALLDLSAATFTVKLTSVTTGATALTKSSGITGAATSPNVTIAWSSSELNITPGTYRLWCYARSGGLDRVFDPDSPPLVKVVTAPT